MLSFKHQRMMKGVYRVTERRDNSVYKTELVGFVVAEMNPARWPVRRKSATLTPIP